MTHIHTQNNFCFGDKRMNLQDRHCSNSDAVSFHLAEVPTGRELNEHGTDYTMDKMLQTSNRELLSLLKIVNKILTCIKLLMPVSISILKTSPLLLIL